ncbi:lytic transglycosylase domain-containing protein [Flavihumibacter petaseus]|nr:lytic transglycosylase domain-containing protein [Flavihumibacter petaseus]
MYRSQVIRMLVVCNLFLFLSASAGTGSLPANTFRVCIVEGKAESKTEARKKTHGKMEAYLRSNEEALVAIRKSSRGTFSMMEKILRKYKLPVELKYLAVVESELKSTALSPVGALGTWQLMPETARDLGLQVSDSIDERLNSRLSTKAAALYLRDLYGEFDNWLLALAAYNCGPGPVYKAIKKSGSRDFFELQQYLPQESRGHVQKYIATHWYFEGKHSAFVPSTF